MSLFQKSVLSSYLESVSDSEIDKGWASLQSYKEMATKVQSFKEEEFQADFLTIIFADCFGYISNYKSGEEGNLFFEQTAAFIISTSATQRAPTGTAIKSSTAWSAKQKTDHKALLTTVLLPPLTEKNTTKNGPPFIQQKALLP